MNFIFENDSKLFDCHKYQDYHFKNDLKHK